MKSRYKAATLAAILLLAIGLWWLANWARNGGWPASGAVSGPLPIHIEYVQPADGAQVVAGHGFCAHFNYDAGHGLGDEPAQLIRYYLDGFNVSDKVIDLAQLEYGYPAPNGEPCYRAEGPLRPGWHTVKIAYHDGAGDRFEYRWRFEVIAAPQE
jgi:hypothetical protein